MIGSYHISNHIPDIQVSSFIEYHRDPRQITPQQTRPVKYMTSPISLHVHMAWAITAFGFRPSGHWARKAFAKRSHSCQSPQQEQRVQIQMLVWAWTWALSTYGLHTGYSSIYFVKLEREAYSTRENRYPMHACGPPRNVSMLPHTPGMVLAASLDDSQRSGLSQSRSISNFDQDTEYTYLNSRASFPHNASDRLIGRIGINTICPLRTLRSINHSIMYNLHNKSVTIDRLTICYRKFSLSYQRTAFRVAQHHLSQLPSSCQWQANVSVTSPAPLSRDTTGNWAHPWLDYLTE